MPSWSKSSPESNFFHDQSSPPQSPIFSLLRTRFLLGSRAIISNTHRHILWEQLMCILKHHVYLARGHPLGMCTSAEFEVANHLIRILDVQIW